MTHFLLFDGIASVEKHSCFGSFFLLSVIRYKLIWMGTNYNPQEVFSVLANQYLELLAWELFSKRYSHVKLLAGEATCARWRSPS